MSSVVLNTSSASSRRPSFAAGNVERLSLKSSIELSVSLISDIVYLFATHQNELRENGVAALEQIQSHPSFAHFRASTQRLKAVNLKRASSGELEVFWVNVFHTLVLDTYVSNWSTLLKAAERDLKVEKIGKSGLQSLGGVPGSSARTRRGEGFYVEALVAALISSRYIVVDVPISAFAIDHLILRSESNDPKCGHAASEIVQSHLDVMNLRVHNRWRLAYPEPLISFVLSYATFSTPAIYILRPPCIAVGETLQIAARKFLEDSVTLSEGRTPDGAFLGFPFLLRQYCADLGAEENDILQWSFAHLGQSKADEVEHFLEDCAENEIAVRVQYAAEDWRFRFHLELQSTHSQDLQTHRRTRSNEFEPDLGSDSMSDAARQPSSGASAGVRSYSVASSEATPSRNNSAVADTSLHDAQDKHMMSLLRHELTAARESAANNAVAAERETKEEHVSAMRRRSAPSRHKRATRSAGQVEDILQRSDLASFVAAGSQNAAAGVAYRTPPSSKYAVSWEQRPPTFSSQRKLSTTGEISRPPGANGSLPFLHSTSAAIAIPGTRSTPTLPFVPSFRDRPGASSVSPDKGLLAHSLDTGGIIRPPSSFPRRPSMPARLISPMSNKASSTKPVEGALHELCEESSSASDSDSVSQRRELVAKNADSKRGSMTIRENAFLLPPAASEGTVSDSSPTSHRSSLSGLDTSEVFDTAFLSPKSPLMAPKSPKSPTAFRRLSTDSGKPDLNDSIASAAGTLGGSGSVRSRGNTAASENIPAMPRLQRRNSDCLRQLTQLYELRQYTREDLVACKASIDPELDAFIEELSRKVQLSLDTAPSPRKLSLSSSGRRRLSAVRHSKTAAENGTEAVIPPKLAGSRGSSLRHARGNASANSSSVRSVSGPPVSSSVESQAVARGKEKRRTLHTSNSGRSGVDTATSTVMPTAVVAAAVSNSASGGNESLRLSGRRKNVSAEDLKISLRSSGRRKRDHHRKTSTEMLIKGGRERRKSSDKLLTVEGEVATGGKRGSNAEVAGAGAGAGAVVAASPATTPTKSSHHGKKHHRRRKHKSGEDKQKVIPLSSSTPPSLQDGNTVPATAVSKVSDNTILKRQKRALSLRHSQRQQHTASTTDQPLSPLPNSPNESEVCRVLQMLSDEAAAIKGRNVASFLSPEGRTVYQNTLMSIQQLTKIIPNCTEVNKSVIRLLFILSPFTSMWQLVVNSEQDLRSHLMHSPHRSASQRVTLSQSGSNVVRRSGGRGRNSLTRRSKSVAQLFGEPDALDEDGDDGNLVAVARRIGVNEPQTLELHVCRICDEKILCTASAFTLHCLHCARAQEIIDNASYSSDERLVLLMRYLRATAEDISVKDRPVLLNLMDETQSIAVNLRYGSEDAVPKLQKLCRRLKKLVARDFENKSALHSFGQRLVALVEEKLRAADLVARARETKGKVTKEAPSMWGLLSLFAKGREKLGSSTASSRSETDSGTVIGEELSPALYRALGNDTPRRRGPSINDFDLLKPISSGGFGTVFLGRKRTTGDIYAIKVMKKSSLMRKNLVKQALTERNVMAMSENPFVVKLYYAFESKTKIYFVMDFAIGGDCGSLLNALGCFEPDMAKRYIAETVLALGYLHSFGIIHRDLKPENMLIGAAGHIILTDFGLSEIGVIGSAQPSVNLAETPNDSPRVTLDASASETGGRPITPHTTPRSSARKIHPITVRADTSASSSSHRVAVDDDISDSPVPLNVTTVKQQSAGGRWKVLFDKVRNAATGLGPASVESTPSPLKEGKLKRRFAHLNHDGGWQSMRDHRERIRGTPDYLAPEVLLSLPHDETVDLWALGIVLFEFLTGVPPFNDDTREAIQANILRHDIPWDTLPPECDEHTHDLLRRLLEPDSAKRLGANGIDEVKEHPYFAGMDWDTLYTSDEGVPFVPQPVDELDTSYFLARPHRPSLARVGNSEAKSDENESGTSSSDSENSGGETENGQPEHEPLREQHKPSPRALENLLPWNKGKKSRSPGKEGKTASADTSETSPRDSPRDKKRLSVNRRKQLFGRSFSFTHVKNLQEKNMAVSREDSVSSGILSPRRSNDPNRMSGSARMTSEELTAVIKSGSSKTGSRLAGSVHSISNPEGSGSPSEGSNSARRASGEVGERIRRTSSAELKRK